jgi:acyl carrier protein
MRSKEDVLTAIGWAIDDLNKENKSNISKSPDTNLIGYVSELDSLGLVMLIVKIEQRVYRGFNIHITIADDKAMSQKHSPFKTIDTLANYVLELINEKEK